MSQIAKPEPGAGRPKWVVMKFGGTSVSTAELWAEIGRQIRERIESGHRVMVVVSAIRGVTDALNRYVEQADGVQADEVLAFVLGRQRDLLSSLGLQADDRQTRLMSDLEGLLRAPAERLSEPRHQATVLAHGELLSSALGAAFLAAEGLPVVWQDARDLLTGRDGGVMSQRASYLSVHCDHAPDHTLADNLAAQSEAHITQGFIASNHRGETVLLGRGGSDTSASYLAGKLDAERLQIWTDVPGMFSANPHHLPGARLLRHLGYAEAQELASMGARVLHPRCLGPVRERNIPLEIRQTARPEIEGTVISEHARDFGAQIKAIVNRSGITLIAMEGLTMWHQVGFLADAFEVFKRHGISVDLISTSESNVTVSLDLAAHLLDPHTLDRVIEELGQLCHVAVLHDCASVSLVGRGIRTILHRLGPAMEVFEQRRIHLVSQASNDLNLTFVVDHQDSDKLVQQLHQNLIPGGIGGDSVFGHTWEQLFRDERPERAGAGHWWRARRADIEAAMEGRQTAYLYDADTLADRAGALLGLGNVDRVFYAMKANPHPKILSQFAELGLGIECVSPGEVRAARQAAPDLAPERILFTPNFAAREEYLWALEQGVHLTIDNVFVLEQWGADLAGSSLIARIDPGSGLGHHKLVRTAGVHSKFGIPPQDLDQLAALCRRHQIQLVGLHAHTGSGILHPDAWHRTMSVLSELCREFPAVRSLDIGGGLGVPEKLDDLPLDLAALDRGIGEIRERVGRDIEVWLEPGRFLVSEAGVLVARVTQTKGKGEVQYVGVTTGMNSLIRPALYGAFHEIFNLSRLDQPAERICNVVGPICETGDILGLDRLLPQCHPGDLLLIATAGAYGAAMASRYNLRDAADEIYLEPT